MIVLFLSVLHPEKKLSWFIDHLPGQISNVQEMFLKFVGCNFVLYTMMSLSTNANIAQTLLPIIYASFHSPPSAYC